MIVSFLPLKMGVFLERGGAYQPRPQGFSLKKWVYPTHFLREKPWGQGWELISMGGPHPFFKGKALGTRLGAYFMLFDRGS